MITSLGIVLSSLMCQAQIEKTFDNDRLWQWHMPPVEVRSENNPPADGDPDEQIALAGFFELEERSSPPYVMTIDDRMPIIVCGSVPDTELRIVGFDEKRNRLVAEGCASGGVRGGGVSIQSLKVGRSRLKYLGVEKLTPEAKMSRAKEAAKALSASGVTLSYPVEGEPYPYRFPGIDSKAHAGQVVILQWWASW